MKSTISLMQSCFFTECPVRIKTRENKFCTQTLPFCSKHTPKKVASVLSQAGKVLMCSFFFFFFNGISATSQ